MKQLLMLSLSLAVVIAMPPPLEPGVEEAAEPVDVEKSQDVVLSDDAEVKAGETPEGQVQVESDVLENSEPQKEPEVKEPGAALVKSNLKAPESETGVALDNMGEAVRPLQGNLSNQEATINFSQVSELKSDLGLAEEEKVEAAMPEEGGEAAAQRTIASRWGNCPGVILYGKCYQFFGEPRRAEHAEFFCQERFPGGHLASITSAIVHRELMSLILRQNGFYTRTWVGGLRYLQTNRFIWLDGSQWKYADWLPGEPNHTAGLENCVEVLAYGNGKFNDFTCWEPQAFICSYPYH